jgi:hypothetical protein
MLKTALLCMLKTPILCGLATIRMRSLYLHCISIVSPLWWCADFVWLRNTLATNYLHALIPVLSDKEKLPAQRAPNATHELLVRRYNGDTMEIQWRYNGETYNHVCMCV